MISTVRIVPAYIYGIVCTKYLTDSNESVRFYFTYILIDASYEVTFLVTFARAKSYGVPMLTKIL